MFDCPVCKKECIDLFDKKHKDCVSTLLERILEALKTILELSLKDQAPIVKVEDISAGIKLEIRDLTKKLEKYLEE